MHHPVTEVNWGKVSSNAIKLTNFNTVESVFMQFYVKSEVKYYAFLPVRLY